MCCVPQFVSLDFKKKKKRVIIDCFVSWYVRKLQQYWYWILVTIIGNSTIDMSSIFLHRLRIFLQISFNLVIERYKYNTGRLLFFPSFFLGLYMALLIEQLKIRQETRWERGGVKRSKGPHNQAGTWGCCIKDKASVLWTSALPTELNGFCCLVYDCTVDANILQQHCTEFSHATHATLIELRDQISIDSWDFISQV